jgi:thiamine-monophosphate kinase
MSKGGEPDRDMLSTLADLGEWGVISLIRERISATWSDESVVVIGIGDDCAVLHHVGDTVVCTDALVSGTHFQPQWASGHDVGIKLAARNFADIAAMGATPTSFLLALVAPATTTIAWLQDFIDGVISECVRAGAVLVGGDTSRGTELAIIGTAVGQMLGASPVTRRGSRVGDVIAISGPTGLAAVGLTALLRGQASVIDDELVTAQVAPRPNYAAARRAAVVGATSMIDCSDGLISDLTHLAVASSHRFAIDSSLVPMVTSVRLVSAALGLDALHTVFTGGEDHVFLATFASPDDVPDDFTIIGSVTSGSPEVFVDGQPWHDVGGFEHYRS